MAVGALLITGSMSATAATAPNIVGGTPASTTYAFAGSLQLDKNDDPNWHTCGVTLFNANFAETNAHCVSNPPTEGARAMTAHQRFGNWLSDNATPAVDRSDPSIYHIRFGSNDRLNGGVVRHVKKITVNPAWNWMTSPNPNGEVGDIAILQLDSPVTTIQPALPSPADTSLVAREIGWGITDEAGEAGWTGPLPQNLSQIDVPVVDKSACADAGIGTGELCLGGQGGGTCNGDSGSPVLQTQGTHPAWGIYIGSDSRTLFDTCGDVGETDVYTDVWYYTPWIIQVITA